MRIIKVFWQLTDALLIVDECVCFFYVLLLDSFYCCIFKSISLHLQCLIGHYYHLIHVLISDIIVLFTEVQFGSFLYLSWPLLNFWDTGNTVIIIFMSFSANANICISSRFILVWLFSSLWNIFSCFFACLLLFFFIRWKTFVRWQNFTLLGYRHFCIPINVLKLSPEMQLSYLEIVWSFQVLLLNSLVGPDQFLV